MTILVEVLPFLALALAVTGGAGYYLFRESQRRVHRRRVDRSKPPEPQPAPIASPAAAPVDSPAVSRPKGAPRPQEIMQLHDLGIPKQQIASVLGVALEEVELVALVHGMRGSPGGPAPSGVRQRLALS